MKLSRRGVFGAAAGAVVAGPGVTKSALNQWPTPPYASTGDAANCKLSDPRWEAEQIAKARRLAAGDFRDEDRNYPVAGPICPYAPLKSASEAAKHFLRDRNYQRQWEQRTIKAALDALDHYDKTGILRHFF